MKTTAILMLMTLNVVVLGIGSALAGEVGELNNFEAKTPAVAAEVNENFNAVATAVNDNNTRIEATETNIGGNNTRIEANETNISDNKTRIEATETNISDFKTRIEANETNISDNKTRIEAIKAGLLDYSQPQPAFINVDSLGVRDVDPDTVLREISFVSPADGYVMVSVTGRGCIHTDGGYIELFLKRGDDYLDYLSFYSVRGVGSACGVGESTQFSWQYIEAVNADTAYNFEVAGHKGSGDSITGNVYITNVAAIFLPGL